MKGWALLMAMGMLSPGIGQAEVVRSGADGFLLRHEYSLGVAPDAAWQALIHPELWWPAAHTWSGDARNMSLDASAGGCFCERWDGGSVEHGRILMALPGRLLRFQGALGPLQGMALSAVMTMELKTVEASTLVTVTYRVSGDPSHELADFAAVVDSVVGQQFGLFAEFAARH